MTNTDLLKARTHLVITAVRRHRLGQQLIEAGKRHRDSLLRALIPLYATRAFQVIVTSGATQRLWAEHGVNVQATVMARALSEHVGYSRRTRVGIQITPNGVKYVEAALKL
jgi:hypothetical protein